MRQNLRIGAARERLQFHVETHCVSVREGLSWEDLERNSSETKDDEEPETGKYVWDFSIAFFLALYILFCISEVVNYKAVGPHKCGLHAEI